VQGVVNPHGSTGVMDSIWTYYDSLGHITQTEEFFVEKNILIRKEFYLNGQLKSEEKYFDNELTESGEIPDGEWKYWDEKGVLVKKEVYKNGELVKQK
jgi:antitoxin component YwqK of YwqJK toxin-antitoxin module